MLRQRWQLVIEFILARYSFLKPHNKSNQLLSALIYSWNSFFFPSLVWTRLRLISYKAFAPLAPLLGSFATQNTRRLNGRKSRLCNLLRFRLCLLFFCAFISTPSFVANPRHSSNSPFDTREAEGELQCPWTSGQLVPACMQLKPTGNCHTRHMRHTQAAATHWWRCHAPRVELNKN